MRKRLNEAIAWDVFLNGKNIDTVWSTEQDAEEMKKSLVNHDNYDPRIVVKMAAASTRKPRGKTSEERLREAIRSLLRKQLQEEEELDELSGTGGVAGFNSPFAFQGDSSANKKKHKDTAQQAGFEEVDDDRSDEPASMHTEGKNPYYTLRNDETRSPRQKVGQAIVEVSRRLTEIERIMKRHSRLKKEVGLNSAEYWKRTNEALVKMEGRIHRIAQTISELRN